MYVNLESVSPKVSPDTSPEGWIRDRRTIVSSSGSEGENRSMPSDSEEESDCEKESDCERESEREGGRASNERGGAGETYMILSYLHSPYPPHFG